jgi:hypothetical protein
MDMLGRSALFAFWCLVLWGTLWDLALLFALLTRGAGAAAETLFVPPVQNAAAAWASRLCGLLAVVVWGVVLGTRWSSPRKPA